MGTKVVQESIWRGQQALLFIFLPKYVRWDFKHSSQKIVGAWKIRYIIPYATVPALRCVLRFNRQMDWLALLLSSEFLVCFVLCFYLVAITTFRDADREKRKFQIF